jgi:hypothetical protein
MKKENTKLQLNQETLRNLNRNDAQGILNCSVPRTEPFTICLTCDCAGKKA